MKKYLPIKIFSINFAYGWWWGGYFFFFTPFAIIPMWLHHQDCTYENGKDIYNGDTVSWSQERQREKAEDEERRVRS